MSTNRRAILLFRICIVLYACEGFCMQFDPIFPLICWVALYSTENSCEHFHFLAGERKPNRFFFWLSWSKFTFLLPPLPFENLKIFLNITPSRVLRENCRVWTLCNLCLLTCQLRRYIDGKKNKTIFLNEFGFHTQSAPDIKHYLGSLAVCMTFIFLIVRVGLEGECCLLRSSRFLSDPQGRVMQIWLPFFHSLIFPAVTLTLKHGLFLLLFCFFWGGRGFANRHF